MIFYAGRFLPHENNHCIYEELTVSHKSSGRIHERKGVFYENRMMIHENWSCSHEYKTAAPENSGSSHMGNSGWNEKSSTFMPDHSLRIK